LRSSALGSIVLVTMHVYLHSLISPTVATSTTAATFDHSSTNRVQMTHRDSLHRNLQSGSEEVTSSPDVDCNDTGLIYLVMDDDDDQEENSSDETDGQPLVGYESTFRVAVGFDYETVIDSAIVTDESQFVTDVLPLLEMSIARSFFSDAPFFDGGTGTNNTLQDEEMKEFLLKQSRLETNDDKCGLNSTDAGGKGITDRNGRRTVMVRRKNSAAPKKLRGAPLFRRSLQGGGIQFVGADSSPTDKLNGGLQCTSSVQESQICLVVNGGMVLYTPSEQPEAEALAAGLLYLQGALDGGKFNNGVHPSIVNTRFRTTIIDGSGTTDSKTESVPLNAANAVNNDPNEAGSTSTNLIAIGSSAAALLAVLALLLVRKRMNKDGDNDSVSEISADSMELPKDLQGSAYGISYNDVPIIGKYNMSPIDGPYNMNPVGHDENNRVSPTTSIEYLASLGPMTKDGFMENNLPVSGTPTQGNMAVSNSPSEGQKSVHNIDDVIERYS